MQSARRDDGDEKARSIVPAARRVLWDGPHFGRLTRAGRTFLLRSGWERLDDPPGNFRGWRADNNSECCGDKTRSSGNNDGSSGDVTNSTDVLLAFAWPSKSGLQFAVNSLMPALVRPYPTYLTDVVDDKLRLQSLLRDSGIMPPSISWSEAAEGKLYFVKHRHGAQGKSVRVHTKQSLAEWHEGCSGKGRNRGDFVIQEEVKPALDGEGRKFVLRAHVLLYQRGRDCCGSRNNDETHQHTNPGFIRAALHEDVICQTHAVAYDAMSTDRSIHVSQAGQKRSRKKKSGGAPVSCLLSELDPSHPASDVFDGIKDCSAILVDAMGHYLMAQQQQPDAPQLHPTVSAFALMGIDYLVASAEDDGTKAVRVCEVNSHPALGWGSMSDVPAPVFARLVEETLSVLLLSDETSESWEGTGFADLRGSGSLPGG